MKSKPVFALPEVQDDLEVAKSHYASWRADGSEHFLDKYEETIRWIEWNPDSFPKKFGRVQRAILKKSYYLVYFIQEKERTIVIAVLDGRRDPKIIRRLIKRRHHS
ncbi:MAG: type II toxin-antitoxin system RelE/ParE family toxin [Opitutaceae bacterium]|jgi:plasmid stabilization system protein ParE|nr:type II toxin-antitoxin system RelE/ParE family toxin [Opitutaceae bacterium]